MVISKNLSLRDYLFNKKTSENKSVDVIDLTKFQKKGKLNNMISDIKRSLLFLSRWTADPMVNEHINLNISHFPIDSKQFKNWTKQFEIHDTSFAKKMLWNVSKKLEDLFNRSMKS